MHVKFFWKTARTGYQNANYIQCMYRSSAQHQTLWGRTNQSESFVNKAVEFIRLYTYSHDVNACICNRARPLIPLELLDGARPCIKTDEQAACVTLGHDRRFTFDHAFGVHATQVINLISGTLDMSFVSCTHTTDNNSWTLCKTESTRSTVAR